jgi:hypothetical protein
MLKEKQIQRFNSMDPKMLAINFFHYYLFISRDSFISKRFFIIVHQIFISPAQLTQG